MKIKYYVTIADDLTEVTQEYFYYLLDQGVDFEFEIVGSI